MANFICPVRTHLGGRYSIIICVYTIRDVNVFSSSFVMFMVKGRSSSLSNILLSKKCRVVYDFFFITIAFRCKPNLNFDFL